MASQNGQTEKPKGIAPLYPPATPSDEQERLAELVKAHGSLLAVSNAIKVNEGYLSAIRRGKRRASNKVRERIGLHPRAVLIVPCPIHGIVHEGKCPRPPIPDWARIGAEFLGQREKRGD